MLTSAMLRSAGAALAGADGHRGFFIGGLIDRAYADIGQGDDTCSTHPFYYLLLRWET
jgi:hypothetical protein